MKFYFLFFFVFCISFVKSQESEEHKIAIQYFNNQEFDKAEILLKNLYQSNPKTYYKYYKKTLKVLKKDKEVFHIIKNQIKIDPSDISLKVDLAQEFKEQGDDKSSEKEYKELISKFSLNTQSAIDLYLVLEKNREFKYAIDLILATKKNSKSPYFLDDKLIISYILLKDYTAAADFFIKEIDSRENDYFNIINQIQYYIENKEFLKIVEKQVFTQLSKNANSDKWNEVAIWLSLQIKDYDEAILLSKAIDKRKLENGNRVFSIANIALHEDEYKAALDGFNYLSKKPNHPYVQPSKEQKINTLLKILNSKVSQDSILNKSIQVEFDNFFSEYSMNINTATTQLVYAEYLVKNQNYIDSAIKVLKNLIVKPGLQKSLNSTAKLALADYLLITNDVWEAALLYGQVDKDEKDSPLGEEARFKNSRLFYYTGEFELAEELLSILKASTTELIANDALNLALFIQENKDGDSLESALKYIAQSELLFYQNKNSEALNVLSEVKKETKSANLLDDIALIEAQLYIKQANYIKAEYELLKFKMEFKNSVLADKAIFFLAKIQEKFLNKNEEAKENYLLILTNFKDSVFTIESRKNLRKLRGENLEEEML